MGLKDEFYKRFIMGGFISGMPKAQIAWISSTPNQIYVADNPSFCWVTKMIDGVRHQHSEWMTCRESFIDAFRNQLHNGKVVVPKNRVCFLIGRAIHYSTSAKTQVAFQQKFLAEVKRGVKLVNILEAHAGWTRTRMFDVRSGSWAKKNNGAAYLITGPSRWLRAPQLLSLYTLLLRLGRFQAFDSVKTVKGIIDVSKKITSKGLGGIYASGDRSFISATRSAWLPLIEDMDTLYKGRTLHRNYLRKYLENGDSGFSEGVSRLARGKTKDPELRKRWSNLLQQRKAKS